MSLSGIAFAGSVAGVYGTLTINAAGNYGYAVNAGAELGSSALDVFTITTIDNTGFITSTQLSFIADPLSLVVNDTTDHVINSTEAHHVSFTVDGLARIPARRRSATAPTRSQCRGWGTARIRLT